MSKATVHNFKRNSEEGKDLEDITIPAKKRGRPLFLLEEIDRKCVENLRACGSLVSSSTVLAAAKGIVTHKSCKEHGGPVELKKSWAFSFLSRHGYVKQKAT